MKLRKTKRANVNAVRKKHQFVLRVLGIIVTS